MLYELRKADALILRSKLLKQLNITDKGKNINFSICDDIGQDKQSVEIDKEQLKYLQKWLKFHI